MRLGKAGKYLVGICLHGGCGEKRSRNAHKFLRTTSCKLALLTVSKKEPIRYILFQIDSNKVLSNLLKLGDTSPTLLNTRREI